MQINQLVTMANQIGDFFKSFPDQVQARKDIALHISRFWAQSMREQILRHVLENNGAGLESVVQESIREHLNNQDIKLHISTAEHYQGQ